MVGPWGREEKAFLPALLWKRMQNPLSLVQCAHGQPIEKATITKPLTPQLLVMPSWVEFEVEWFWKWSNPRNDKSEPECQSTSYKPPGHHLCWWDNASHFLLLSPGSSATTESARQAVASASCLPPFLTIITTTSNGHFSKDAVEKNPLTHFLLTFLHFLKISSGFSD